MEEELVGSYIYGCAAVIHMVVYIRTLLWKNGDVIYV
jgi:hypothetical protein